MNNFLDATPPAMVSNIMSKNALGNVHRVFISYHHENDQKYKKILVKEFAEKHGAFINESVDMGDVSEDLTDQAIRRKIRDGHLRHSTVTIVLVGADTRNRKHVDWEIHSSMYDGSVSGRSGIIVILLPTVRNGYVRVAHGDEEKSLYPDDEWTSVSKAEFRKQHPYMPQRLTENILKDDALISVVSWDKLTPAILKALIQMAFRDRENCKYDLSQPMRKKNTVSG